MAFKRLSGFVVILLCLVTGLGTGIILWVYRPKVDTKTTEQLVSPQEIPQTFLAEPGTTEQVKIFKFDAWNDADIDPNIARAQIKINTFLNQKGLEVRHVTQTSSRFSITFSIFFVKR